jgi:NPCBM/NEW2 domain
MDSPDARRPGGLKSPLAWLRGEARSRGDYIAVGVIVAIIVTVISVALGSGSSPGPGPPTPTTTKTGPTTTKTGPTTTKTGPTTPEPAQYLDSLQQSESTSKTVTSGATNVSGRRFPHGITIASLGATSSENPNGAKFVLPGQFASFRALVGVDPSSAPGFGGSMGVAIANEGHAFLTTTVSRGSPPCSINVPIGGAGMIELQVFPSSGEPLAVAFGDARVVGEKDFAGMPSGPRC